MKTIEEKAKEYLMNFPTTGTFSIEEMIVNAFVAGANSEKPKWKIGNNTDNLKYGAVCVIIEPYNTKMAHICTWNDKEKCWYNMDGIWECASDEVLYYLEIPRCDYLTGQQG